MLTPALLGLSISLLLDVLPVGSGTRVDLAAGARAEVNVGRLPVASTQVSSTGTEETIVLRSGLRVISPTSSLILAYTPQYYLRVPDVLGIGRPLLLHDGRLVYSARLTPRLSLDWTFRSAAGELSNSRLTTVFDPGTGTLDSRVVPIVSLATRFAMNALTGRRHRSSLAIIASHNDSIGPDSAFERSDNARLQLSHTLTLSRRSAAGVSGEVGYVAQEGQLDSAIVGGQVFVDQRLGDESNLRVGVGINQGWALGGELTWPLPTLDVAYRTAFAATGQRWALNMGGGTRAFFDVTSAVYRPQGYVTAGLSGQIHQVWTVSSNLTFSADISGQEPTLEDGEQGTAQPTQFNFDVPVSYRIDTGFYLNFGLRVALNAPPLWSFDTGTFQDQFSFFAALEWRTSNERTRGGWL